jgi:TRAP-type mannitol/chloroaromatic compound transport system substrate-binding protein
MKYFITGLFIGLIVGVIIATNEPESNVKQTNLLQLGIEKIKTPLQRSQWRTASLFPSSTFPSGISVQKLVKNINFLTRTTLELKLFEPGTLVPVFSSFDAVSSGRIEAAVSSPSFLGEKSRSFELLDGFPFGPGANEFLAWHQIGGGEKLSQSLYQRYNIHGLVCGITGPTFGGWFREPVQKIADLQKKRVAAVGLGATVLSRAGVLTTLIAPQDIRSAIQSGKIFGATIGAPYAIGKNESKQSTGHIYFPGWHQQYSVLNLMINIRNWDSLNRQTKDRIEIACTANIADSISQSEGHRFDMLKSLVDRGFTVGRWPPRLLNKLKSIWQEEVLAYRSSEGEFGKIWRSLENFRKNYSIWQELGYL